MAFARQVLNAIDPEVRLIQGRVLCREDNQPDNFSKRVSRPAAGGTWTRP